MQGAKRPEPVETVSFNDSYPNRVEYSTPSGSLVRDWGFAAINMRPFPGREPIVSHFE